MEGRRTGSVGSAIGGLLLGALLLPAPTFAQEPSVGPLLQRLEHLERDILVLQRRVFRGEGGTESAPGRVVRPPLELAAQTEVRLVDLEGQLRELTGRLEEFGFELGGMRDRLEKAVSDLEQRLAAMEQAGRGLADAGESGGGPSPTTLFGTIPRTEPGAEAGTATAAAPKPPPDARESYNAARLLVFEGAYDRAEQALRQFLEAHPDHELADNARYWLAETFYVRGNFEQAAVAYADGYERSPHGTKAPDNLLKLGVALRRLGKNQEACSTFEHLAREFPDASPTIEERARREADGIGCR